MKLNCDDSVMNYSTDGTAALDTEDNTAVPARKQKSRRKNKNRADTYALEKGKNPEKSINEEKNGCIITDNPDIDKKSEEEIPAETGENEISFGGSIITEAGHSPEKNRHVPETEGIVYEIAQELYQREKTQAELEALCAPPFHKEFSESEKIQLDRKAENRTRRILRNAGANSAELTFLPDGLYEESDRPIKTSDAFLMQFIMMIPVINVVGAVFFAFSSGKNKNIRSFCRAFLIWTILFMSALLIALALYYVRTETAAPDSELLAVWRRLGF